MKAITLATLVLGLSSSAYAKSIMITEPESPVEVVEPAKSYTFKVDFRPSDGPKHLISVAPGQNGTYNAVDVLTTSGFGGPVTTTSKILGERLVCKETVIDMVLTNLTCSKDKRPLDGQLTEVIFDLDDSGKYTAYQHISYADLFTGEVIDEVTKITYGLTLSSN
jgi:hypothetical protein